MIVITMTELKNDLKKYTELAKTEDVIITKNGKPHIKLVDFYNNKTDVIDRLAGSIKLDKSYEELMDERYSKIWLFI